MIYRIANLKEFDESNCFAKRENSKNVHNKYPFIYGQYPYSHDIP